VCEADLSTLVQVKNEETLTCTLSLCPHGLYGINLLVTLLTQIWIWIFFFMHHRACLYQCW